MATRLEQALQNAHAAGDTQAAKTLAAAVREERANQAPDLDAQLAGLFGETAPPSEPQERTAGDYGKAGLSLATSAITGIPATIYGTVEGIAGTVADGTFGTYAGAQQARENVQQRQQDASYIPESPGARGVLQDVGETLEPLGYLTDPMMGFAPLATAGRPPLRTNFPQAMAARRQPQAPQQPAGTFGAGRHAGSAQTATDAQRATTAADLPIPMTGERAPTLGQLTRDQTILRRERELAKNDDLGGPLRARYDNQLEGLNANLENLEQQFPVREFDDRGIGQATATAIEQRKASQYQKVGEAYAKAREAGELEKPVTLGNLDDLKLETQQLESLAPNAMPIYKEAQRLGVLDADGNPQTGPIQNLETLRQFTIKASDPADRQQNRFRKLWAQAIDQTIDGAEVGPLYRDARRKYSSWVNEFEETPLTRDVIKTKRGTNERAMPYENVFKRTVLGGSVDEVNKLRSSLLRTDEGKQAWFDLKARFARHIAEQSRTSNTTANDQPIISPYKLGKTIDEMDRTGKLESIFGKQGAAEVRNIRETAQSMLTVPPNTVNASGTSAEIFNMLMRVGGRVPGVGRLQKAVENSGIRKDVDRSLSLKDRPDLQRIMASGSSSALADLERALGPSKDPDDMMRNIARELRKGYTGQ